MPLTHVVRNLGLNANVLTRWTKRLKTNPVNAFTGKGAAEQEEIIRFKKKLADVSQQR
jgi:hypothetical protein